MIKNFLKIGMLTAAIAVAVLAIPSVSFAASPTIIIGGVSTSANADFQASGSGVGANAAIKHGDVSWDATRKTLTFNNASIEGIVEFYLVDVNINLIGSNNSVTATSAAAAISGTNSITFTGTGHLTVTNNDISGGAGVQATSVTINNGSFFIVGEAYGVDGNLVVNGGSGRIQGMGNGVSFATSKDSVSGTITQKGVGVTKTNPFNFDLGQQQQQQQEQQQVVSREGVVFAMDRDLSYPNGLVFAFHNGYFANFEGVWIHGYAVPEAAYSVDVHNGIAYVFLNRDYLYYVLGLATNEQHLLHVVFSNGYGVTNFTFN